MTRVLADRGKVSPPLPAAAPRAVSTHSRPFAAAAGFDFAKIRILAEGTVAERDGGGRRSHSPLSWLDRIDGAVQAKADGRERVDRDPAGTHEVAQHGIEGASESLPHADRIQAAFGTHDVSQVRVQVGGAAADASRSMGAKAYAVGDRVAFAAPPDLHIAAHEAAHVVQQRAGVSLKGGLGESGDPYERHAAAVATAVVSGQSAERLLDSGPIAAGHSGTAIQCFGGDEHRDMGDEASGGRKLNFPLDDGSTLSFGDMVMLSQDLFGSLDEMQNMAKTKEGQLEIRWARWWSRSASRADRGAEPPADAATKKRVRDRYETLAATNFAHFLAGGDARSTYEDYHRKAVAHAILSGATGNTALLDQAMIIEAFGQHNLSDMFSAGHLRTPRRQLKDYYNRRFPGSIDRLVKHLANKLYDELAGPMPWYWQAMDRVGIKDVHAKLERKIRAQGGPAIAAYTLGDIVSLAHHDRDNAKGLEVTAAVGPSGVAVAGGHHWLAKGDGHLAESPDTRLMTVSAMKVSLKEVQDARALGATVALSRPPPSPLDIVGMAAWVEGIVQGLPPPGALRYLPTADEPGPNSPNDQMDWEWGSMNEEMVAAVTAAVTKTIIPELRKNAPESKLRMDRQGEDDPHGAIVLDVNAAWLRMCDKLSIKDFESLFGRMAPEPKTPEISADASVPVAGVGEGQR